MKITEEWWEYHYKPILNRDEDSYLFEINDETVKRTDNKYVWTLVDCSGVLYVTAGKHFINRIGFLITTNFRTELIEEEYEFCYEDEYSKNDMIENTVNCILEEFNTQLLTENEIQEKVQTYYDSIQI